jgi:Uncharacterized protein conserved in bacteria (DUF2332)
VSVAGAFTDFATREAQGISPTYERLSLAIARDAELLSLLERVPAPKRQPNLLLAVVRLLGGPVLDCALTGITPPDRLPEIVWRAQIE